MRHCAVMTENGEKKNECPRVIELWLHPEKRRKDPMREAVIALDGEMVLE